MLINAARHVDEWADGEECATCSAWENTSGEKEAGYLEKARDPILDVSLLRKVSKVGKEP